MKAITFILVALPLLCWGQGNLVPNGGFEEIVVCPWEIGLINLASPWMSANGGSPDYFHICFPPNEFGITSGGVPFNAWGKQEAHDGSAYVGIYCFSVSHPEGREYIQVELTEPLNAGIRYQVSFYANLANYCRYAVSTLGVHLSEEPINIDTYWLLDADPQIMHQSGAPLVDTVSWVLVTDTFQSRDGGERYVTIGNFHPAALSDTIHYNQEGDINYRFAYYYIDDVSVVAIDSIPSSIDEAEALEFNVFPNPATGMVQVQGAGIERLQLYDLSGRAVLAEQVLSDRHSLNLSGIPPRHLPAGSV